MTKSKKRHFDNKADLINTLKTNKRKQEYSSAAGCYVSKSHGGIYT